MKKCYNDISGAILAGGRNSRMGSPKYFLKVKGKRIIDSALDVLSGLFPEILIITDDRTRFSDIKRAKIVEDAIKGLGPVGGIYTGLGHASHETVFFVAGDMPFLHIELIRREIGIFKAENCDALVPKIRDSIEPLHAIYKKGLKDNMRHFIAKNSRCSVKDFLKTVNVCYWDLEDNSFHRNAFRNLNTQDDLKEIQGL